MKPLSIGEVARRTGVRTSALRFYEESGLLPAAARVNGRRVYDATVIRRIQGLRFAQEAGFTLEEIKALFHGPGAGSTLGARWRVMARQKLAELDLLTVRLAGMRRALERGSTCGCERIEDCPLSAAQAPAR